MPCGGCGVPHSLGPWPARPLCGLGSRHAFLELSFPQGQEGSSHLLGLRGGDGLVPLPVLWKGIRYRRCAAWPASLLRAESSVGHSLS